MERPLKAFETASAIRAVIFLVLFMLALVELNPSQNQQQTTPQLNGDLAIQMVWPSQIPSDVDLWVQTPQDKPVGFSHKEGKVVSLTKDDLGTYSNDLSGLNYELATAEKAIPGDYHVNVVLYSTHGYSNSIPVTVSVTYRNKDKIVLNKVITVEVDPNHIQKTVLNFTINEDGSLDTNSINSNNYVMEFN